MTKYMVNSSLSFAKNIMVADSHSYDSNNYVTLFKLASPPNNNTICACPKKNYI